MVLTVGPVASLLFFVPLWGPQLALRRIAGNAASETGSFSIADGMILVAMLAVAASLASLLRDGIPRESFLLFVFMAMLLASMLWFKCLKFMSLNGVKGNWQRIAVQIFVYPSSVLSVSYSLILAMLLFSGIADCFDRDVPIAYLCVTFWALILSVGWIYLTRLTYRRILRSEADEDAT